MSNDKKGQQGDPKKSADNLKKKILGSIQGPYMGEQTSRWVLNMNDEQLLSNQLNVASESNNLLDVNVVTLIDRLFDDFQRYVFEYQRTPAGLNFILNCHRPTADDPPARPEYGQVPVLCQGHVSTASWAMIVQGQVGKVNAYIVPVEFLVGFKATQSQFSPFVELKAVAEQGKSEWRIDEHSISQEMLPIISKRIFGALIKVQRGESKNTDKFVFDLSEPDEEEYLEPVEERYKPQLLSDTTGPSQLRSVAQQQQYQQPQFGRPAGQQPVPASHQTASLPPGPPQPAAVQQPHGQTHAYQGPPAFQRSQTGSQQQAPYQQPQAGSQQQAPAYQQAPAGLPQQVSAYQQPQAGQQAPAYQQPQAGQQQAPAYQQPQAGQQQAPVYQQPQAGQQQAPVYQQPQAGLQQAPAYQQPQAGQQQQAPAYQQLQSGQQQQSPAYQQIPPQQAAYQQPQGSQPAAPYQQPQGGSQQQSPAYPQAQQIQPKGFSQQNAQQRAPQPNPQPQQQIVQPNPAYQSPAAASMNHQVFDRNKQIVAASLDELVAKLDIELESLARIGMKAIQSQDMAAAQFTINRATKLKDVRQRVNDLSNEWKSSVS